MPTGLSALGDDDVHTRVRVLAGLGRRATQRSHLTTGLVDVLDHVGRWSAERVRDERDLRMLQCHLDLRGRGGLGPAKQLQRVLIAVVDRDPVVGENLAGEVQVLLRDHRLQRLGEVFGGHVRVHALVFVRDDDVDAVGVVADVLVDPLELNLELFGGEADRTEHPEAAGLAHGHDDVTTVREREDRELDVEFVADRGVHACSSGAAVAELKRVLV